MKEKFSRDFARKREQLGLTRDTLSKMIGVSATAIQNWEDATHNSFPKPQRWKKIFDAMEGFDCMMYRHGVTIDSMSSKVVGNGSVGNVAASNGSTVTIGTSNGKHSVELTDFEYLLLTLYRANGGRAMGEECLQRLLGAGKK